MPFRKKRGRYKKIIGPRCKIILPNGEQCKSPAVHKLADGSWMCDPHFHYWKGWEPRLNALMKLFDKLSGGSKRIKGLGRRWSRQPSGPDDKFPGEDEEFEQWNEKHGR